MANLSRTCNLPGTNPRLIPSPDFLWLFKLFITIPPLPPPPQPGPPPPPPPGGPPSSNKSHILKSVACSTNNSATSPVRSIIEQTSSKLRSIRDKPPHSSIWNFNWKFNYYLTLHLLKEEREFAIVLQTPDVYSLVMMCLYKQCIISRWSKFNAKLYVHVKYHQHFRSTSSSAQQFSIIVTLCLSILCSSSIHIRTKRTHIPGYDTFNMLFTMNDGGKLHAGDDGKRQIKSIRLLSLYRGFNQSCSRCRDCFQKRGGVEWRERKESGIFFLFTYPCTVYLTWHAIFFLSPQHFFPLIT